jgi:hypothetical protein
MPFYIQQQTGACCTDSFNSSSDELVSRFIGEKSIVTASPTILSQNNNKQELAIWIASTWKHAA